MSARTSPIEAELRPPTSEELRLFARLMEREFPGRDELLLQIRTAKVRTIDREGSLEVRVAASVPAAPTEQRVPTEATYRDDDGIEVHLLLHVVSGRLSELEVYKDDGSTICRSPRSQDLTLVAR